MPEEPVAPATGADPSLPAPAAPTSYYNGKYKTVSDLEKAHAELEKKLGQPKGPLDPSPINPFADDNFKPDAVLAKVGVTEEQVYQAAQANGGKIPDDMYAKFKDAGAGKGMVDDYFALRVMTRAQQTETARQEGLRVAGGEKQLETLLQFGKTLPDHVKEKLNADLMNPAMHSTAIVALKGYYDMAHGGQGVELHEGNHGEGDASAYKSQADFYRGANEAKHSSEARTKHEARCKASPAIHTLPRS
jgi:hypothetical protein